MGNYLSQQQTSSTTSNQGGETLSLSQESALEKMLQTMLSDWENISVEVKPWKATGNFIFQGPSIDQFWQILDEQMVRTQAMKGSLHAKKFEKQINEWEEWLVFTQEFGEKLQQVQVTWVYLEPIFSSPDILNRLPNESKIFKEASETWKNLMKFIQENPKVLTFTKKKDIQQQLNNCQSNLDAAQKGLNNYLEEKRSVFPRFYFLSNDELIEILQETQDPLKVQPHLKKCFDGIEKLEFDNEKKVVGMYSTEGEYVKFQESINTAEAKGNVDQWLSQTEKSMKNAVHAVIKQANEEYPKMKRDQWVLNRCGQSVLCTSMTYWTSLTEEAIAKGKDGVKELHKYLNQCMEDIVKLVKSDISKLDRCTIESLIVLDVHNKDIVCMLGEKDLKVNDFTWQSQLRYYMENKETVVKIMNSNLTYNNEYLGNSPRLVFTPLTDKCYRTLCGAIQLNCGGAPQGPAGTGKTESVKDLAKALGTYCVVLNCSDQMDYIMMAKFFKGQASTGVWSCFDEFNRIDIEVLSIVAQQISTIQQAKAKKCETFYFHDSEITLKPTCNIFITMNPGYAGRTELPDNLKHLFRPVSMMIPNYIIIAINILYSQGFSNARELARKVITTYKLCSEQLSQQDHYDHGMRAVKAVLTAAGKLKIQFPQEDESVLVLRAINEVNLPKLLDSDVPLFKGITSDLFQKVQLPEVDNKELKQAIDESIKEFNLQNIDYFQEKTIQLYKTLNVRHGLMVVGQPFSGKSSALKVLQSSLNKLKERGQLNENTTQMEIINPKSITLNNLYGYFDDQEQWIDGILTHKFRNFSKDEGPDRKWLVFDGPVDAIWIENLNAVLDDNKKLFLPNGDLIKLGNNTHMIFEPMDLSTASPATVSRCGMVSMEPQLLGWRPIYDSWKNSLPETLGKDLISELDTCFDKMIDTGLDYIRHNCQQISPSQDQNLVQALLRILGQLLNDEQKDLNISSKFVFSYVWSLGASLTTQSRKLFDQFTRKLASENKISLPENGQLFEYKLVGKNWVKWIDTITPEQIPANSQIQQILVQTSDSVRNSYLLDLHIKLELPILFCGPTGTGKTTYIKNALKKLNSIQIGFSAQTNCTQLQDIIDRKMDKRKEGQFGPKEGKTVIFVDDLNLPQRDVYGAQPPLELLRQYLCQGGWYDNNDKNKSFRNIVDTTLVAAMGPAEQGRSFACPRFLRHFTLVSQVDFDSETFNKIFGTILDWNLKTQQFSPEIQNMSQKIISATQEIYNSTVTQLLPRPTKSHYLFNSRDFSRVIFGVCLANKEKVQTPEDISRLWLHETQRIFGDRLVNEDDRKFLLNNISQTASKCLGLNIQTEEIRNLTFTDIMTPVGAQQKYYEEVKDFAVLQKTVENYLSNYNMVSQTPMNLVLFRYAVEHLLKISRILKTPRENALLIGAGGSGRQSLTRLSCHILDYLVFSIKKTRQYSTQQWRDDLKAALTSAASSKPTVFLLTDSQIKEESFIGDINSLLNSYEIPNLFTAQEVQEIAGGQEQFLQNVQENLHIVLAFSPIGDNFVRKIKMFPSLVNCCTVDWFGEWPEDGLNSVAAQFVKEISLEEDIKAKCVDVLQYFHSEARKLSREFCQSQNQKSYVTPTTFIEMINQFRVLFDEQLKKLTNDQTKYTQGLEKIQETEKTLQGQEQAKQLIELLGAEKDGQSNQGQQIKENLKRLTGDILVSAGIITYLGIFTQEFRQKIQADWVSKCQEKQLPLSKNFSLQKVLGDPTEIREWNTQGLPTDEFSIQNSVIALNSIRWPLFIDPQGQANNWIKQLEGRNQLSVIKLSDQNYLRTLENAILFGNPVLLEDVGEQLDSVLTSILLKQTFRKGGERYIKLGEKELLYSGSFKLYLTTKLKNPNYLPEVSNIVTLINSTLTFENLSEQLLRVIIQREKSTLESEKQRLVLECANNRKQLVETEGQFLKALSESKNILTEDQILKTLQTSKEKSQAITEQQKAIEATEKEIDLTRQQYLPVSQEATCLFFAVCDLTAVDLMYEYSLTYFVDLFSKAIENSEKSNDLEKRLTNIKEYFLYSLYSNITLFQKDKILLSFLLCLRILEFKKEISVEDYRFLLTGGVISSEKLPQKPEINWLTDKMWGEICRLSKLSGYSSLSGSFESSKDEWTKIFNSEEPHKLSLPTAIQQQFNSFQKLCILRTIRIDTLIPQISDFVVEKLGKKFVEPIPFDLEKSYKDSNCLTPLIFLLSPGSNPLVALNKFSLTKKQKITTISLGQGQGPKAAKLISEGQKNGNWVVLENCQLGRSWMITLEKTVQSFNSQNTHKDFRLWLTSSPCNNFPKSILLQGIKIVIEASQGLQNILKNFYENIDPINNSEFIEQCKQPQQLRRLCYGLCFFHAVIEERKQYGSLGWNKPYEFNQCDLQISAKQLNLVLNKVEGNMIPEEELQHILGELNYGGRVTDENDRQLLLSLIEDFCNNSVAQEPNYKLPNNNQIVIPDCQNSEEFINNINQLPNNSNPEVYGLNKNAEITKNVKESNQLLNSLLLTTKQATTQQDEKLKLLLESIQIQPEFDLEAVQKKYPVKYEESMNTVLQQELVRYNRLIRIIRQSVSDLQLALQGVIVMTNDLQEIAKSLLDNKVPVQWFRRSYPSLKPIGGYIKDLKERLAFFDEWIRNGQPVKFWISGFFFTQSFFTGLKQNFARKHSIAIDEIDFDFEVQDCEPQEKPQDGAYIGGLFIEGAKWDSEKKELTESDPKVLFTKSPVIKLIPSKARDMKKYQHYNCPLYKTSVRRGVLSTTGHSTNFVTQIKLPTTIDSKHWQKRGVALLTQLDD